MTHRDETIDTNESPTTQEGTDRRAMLRKMAIGGAPISQMFADEIGADGYGQNASAAVDLFLKLAKQA